MDEKPTQYDRRTVLKALGAATATAAVSGTAAGQEETPTPTGTPEATPDGSEAAEAAVDELTDDTGPNALQLDESIAVTRATYDEDAGEARLVLESTEPQLVTLTDAGGVWTPGRINQLRQVVPSGESSLRLAVTEVDGGRVGVTVAVESGLYAVPIRENSSLFSGAASWQDVQWGFAAGLTGGIGAAAAVAYRKAKSGRKAVERVL